MEQRPDTTGLCERALELHQKGLRVVPLAGKRPLVHGWPDLRLTPPDLRQWFHQPGVNLGIVTGEPLVVLDTDTDDAERWVRAHGIDSPTVVRSGRGGLHRYFRCRPNTEIHSRQGLHAIRGLDVKGWHSFIVAAGSVHPETGRRYDYLLGKEMREVSQLPPFDRAWLVSDTPTPTAVRAINPRRAADPRSCGTIRDVRRYIRSIPSVQGQNGSNACYRVACLLHEAGLTFDAILDELAAWNEACAVPPWSRRELMHKVASVCRTKAGGRGVSPDSW